MKNNGFKFVREHGEVSIVRERASTTKSNTQPTQRIKVMCFDSAQIDRIFRIQENSIRNTSRK